MILARMRSPCRMVFRCPAVWTGGAVGALTAPLSVWSMWALFLLSCILSLPWLPASMACRTHAFSSSVEAPSFKLEPPIGWFIHELPHKVSGATPRL